MKKIDTMFFFILVSYSSLLFSVLHAVSAPCYPDQSIENQKSKKLSGDAKASLQQVMQDAIDLTWPVRVCQCWLSSLFGKRKSGYHYGLDLAAIKGTAVYAAADGYVETVQKNLEKHGYGNMILLNHKPLAYKTRYAHLDTMLVQQGDYVEQGKKIGTVGATGHVVAKHTSSDPSHLHFELYQGTTRIDPLIVLLAADYSRALK